MPPSLLLLLAFHCLLQLSSAAEDKRQELSSREKQKLVDSHNYLRSIADPPATDMQRMEWSDQLAVVAQEYAEQCVFDHNPGRSNHSLLSGAYVGENIAITNNPASDLRNLVRGWYNEREFYDIAMGECVGNECRHYTQVPLHPCINGDNYQRGLVAAESTYNVKFGRWYIWASSVWVGCGVHRCNKTVGFPHLSSTILVCNYAPGGNIAGETPYLAGPVPCSQCPTDKPLCQNNFCVAKVGEDSAEFV